MIRKQIPLLGKISASIFSRKAIGYRHPLLNHKAGRKRPIKNICDGFVEG